MHPVARGRNAASPLFASVESRLLQAFAAAGTSDWSGCVGGWEGDCLIGLLWHFIVAISADGWLICYNTFNERKHEELLEMVVAGFPGGAKFGCGSVGNRVVACAKVCSRSGCRGDFADDADRDHAFSSVDDFDGAGVEMVDDLYSQG